MSLMLSYRVPSLLSLAATGLLAGVLSLHLTPVTSAADLFYPGTGSTRSHHLAWVPGEGHVTAFLLESTPVFGPTQWTPLGELPFSTTCTVSTTRRGAVMTTCQFPAGDTTAQYRITPLNAAGPGMPTVEDSIIRCCRVGEFDSMCFAGLAMPPTGCFSR